MRHLLQAANWVDLDDVISYCTARYDTKTLSIVRDILALSELDTFDRDYIILLCNNVQMDVLNGR